jgi:hypothetical protein
MVLADGAAWALGVSGAEKRSQNEAKSGQDNGYILVVGIGERVVFIGDYGVRRCLRLRRADEGKLQNEATVKVNDATARCWRRLRDNYHASWRASQDPVDRMSTSTSGRMPDATKDLRYTNKNQSNFFVSVRAMRKSR